MKIAIHLYGHLRTFKDCIPTLMEHVVQSHCADVFMHTWDTYERNTPSWHNSSISTGKINIEDINFLHANIPNITLEVNEQPIQELTEQNGISFAHESLFKSINLRFNKFPNTFYDLVVISRPDILFRSGINIELIANIVQDPFFDKKLIQASYHYDSSSIWTRDSFGARDCLMFCNVHACNKLLKMKDKKMKFNIPISIQRTGEMIFDCLLDECNLSSELIKIHAPEHWAIKRNEGILLP